MLKLCCSCHQHFTDMKALMRSCSYDLKCINKKIERRNSTRKTATTRCLNLSAVYFILIKCNFKGVNQRRSTSTRHARSAS